MSESAARQSDVSILLPHPTRQQIIVIQAGEQQRLPQLQIVEDSFEMFNQEVKRLWGLQTTVLRAFAYSEEEASQHSSATFLVEWYNVEHPLPPGLHWLNTNELDRLTFLHPQQQAAVTTCLQEIESGSTPEMRVPWAQVGWQTNTAAWLRTQLAQLGCPVNGAIEQIKTWSLSCVLRAPTASGQVYDPVA